MTKPLSEQNNFTYLTAAPVLLLFLIALADQFAISLGQLIIQAAIIIVLTLGVWSIKSRSCWFFTRVGFIIAIILVTMGGFFLEVVGQFYIAIVVASLIGIRITSQHH